MKMTLENLGGLCDRALGVCLGALMLTLVLSVTWQVTSRHVLQAPSSWTEELARFVLIWIGLLGAAYAYRTRAHMAIDVLPQKLTGAPANALAIAFTLTVIVFAVAVMIVGGSQLVLLTLELNQVSAALGVSMGLVYLVIPLSGALVVFYGLLNLVAILEAPHREHKAGD